jgi:hypothetical protein
MAKKEKIVKISFSYDRLCEQKLTQAYNLLVPGQPEFISSASSIYKPIEDQAYENSRHLYQSILRSAEGE